MDRNLLFSSVKYFLQSEMELCHLYCILQVSGMDGSQFQAMEEPFLHMVNEILQDRYNDKAESLFRKFYQFCIKHMLEGFNS